LRKGAQKAESLGAPAAPGAAPVTFLGVGVLSIDPVGPIFCGT